MLDFQEHLPDPERIRRLFTIASDVLSKDGYNELDVDWFWVDELSVPDGYWVLRERFMKIWADEEIPIEDEEL